MARQSLTATTLAGAGGSGSALDVTALVTGTAFVSGTYSGVTFPWNPLAKLYVQTVTGAVNADIQIGSLTEGLGGLQVVQALATAGHIYEIGPFPMDEQFQAGVMNVDFSTAANVAYAAVVQG